MGMTRLQRATAATASAVFAAAISAAAFIQVPVPGSPVPVVVQNLLAIVSGLVLGPRYGARAVAIFLAAGAIGAPVFSGGRGGYAVLLGPGGGYLAGYLAGAFVAGLVARAGTRTPLRSALASLAGFAVIYLFGVGRLATLPGSSLAKAVAGGLAPFLAVDAAKAAIAAVAGYLVDPFARSLLGAGVPAGAGADAENAGAGSDEA